MSNTQTAEETITCSACGLQWQRSGYGRANENLFIDAVAYRANCKHQEDKGFACPEMRVANSKARQQFEHLKPSW